jgi:succinate-semialdehyde dehydrogenase/glutarate-semialdehyde dehydrogenase
MMTAKDETTLLAGLPTGLLIDGEWRDATGGGRFDVIDPATGSALVSVADATPEDGIAALDAAVAVQDEWASTAPRKRSEILRGAWQLMQDRKDELALLMTLEMGKPLAEAAGEVVYGSEFFRWFAEEAVRITGRYGVNPEGTGRTIVSQHAVGPCYFITPWNFPLAMATRKIGPALAAGCTVVVKPAELTPLTTLLTASILQEAGLPAGVLNVVPTTSAGALTEPVLKDPRLRKLSFTGSTPVGKQLLAQAAENVLRTSMELGGNAPFVVFDDADLDAAVTGAMLAKFRNVGEACTAANRFIVHEAVADEFAERLTAKVADMKVGRGTDEGVQIGPLINRAAVTKADELVQDAVGRGAEVRLGGGPVAGPGTFYAPTVLDRVDAESEILRTEIFGPVVTIVRFSEEAEAVRIANDTEYGLVSYVFTKDLARGQRMIDRLQTGMMGLNVGVISNASAPFGGVKQSGVGREGGFEGIHEYLSTKYTMTPSPFA